MKSIPPKGWPVLVKENHDGWKDAIIRISSGSGVSEVTLMCYVDGRARGRMFGWEYWKPIKLPNGKLLTWPGYKGSKK